MGGSVEGKVVNCFDVVAASRGSPKIVCTKSGVATRGRLRSLKGGGVTRPLWTFRCGFADVWVSAEEEKVSRGRGRIGRKGPPWWIQREEWHCERCLASTRWPLATMKHQRTGIGIPHAPVLRDRPDMVPNQGNKQQKDRKTGQCLALNWRLEGVGG